jgi:hypothetical protein
MFAKFVRDRSAARRAFQQHAREKAGAFYAAVHGFPHSAREQQEPPATASQDAGGTQPHPRHARQTSLTRASKQRS